MAWATNWRQRRQRHGITVVSLLLQDGTDCWSQYLELNDNTGIVQHHFELQNEQDLKIVCLFCFVENMLLITVRRIWQWKNTAIRTIQSSWDFQPILMHVALFALCLLGLLTGLFINIQPDWNNTYPIQNPYFASIQITATSYHLLICNTCRIAHSSCDMLAHLRGKNHGIKPGNEFLKEASRCGISDTPIPIPTVTVPALYGLPIFDGLKCNSCQACAKNLHSLQQHKCSRTTLEPIKTPMQSFNKSRTPKWFPVSAHSISAPSSSSRENAIDNIVTLFQNQSYQQQISEDARTISPWLKATKWHLRTSSLHIVTALGIINSTKSIEDQFLLRCVKEYFTAAATNVASLSTLVRQRLNTDDPQKTYV